MVYGGSLLSNRVNRFGSNMQIFATRGYSNAGRSTAQRYTDG
jgi:hypothetical protein